MHDEAFREKLCRGVISSEDEDAFRKVEKIVAPFMRTLKKRRPEKADVLPTAHEELYLKHNPKELLTRLQTGFSDPLEFKTLMNETAELLKVVTKSKSVNLYFTDYERGELFVCPKYYQSSRFQRKYPIETGTYLAAHVAFTKEYVISSDILGDVRFPMGIPEAPAVKSAICLPIITNVKENCIGIIELYRVCSEKPYDLTHLQICNALMAWMGIAMEQNTLKMTQLKELEIQNELAILAELYFSGGIPFNKVISDVVKIVKAAVNAEKGAFYMFRDPVPLDSEHMLLADAFEEGEDETGKTVLYKKTVRARFEKNGPGIAGHVARKGKIINIQDAYKDYRFDRKSDSPFHRTRSLLALPIKNESGVLAVLQLVNSASYPFFRPEDEDLIQSFLYNVNLICGYFFLNTSYNQSKLKVSMMEKLLEYHLKPSPDDINDVKILMQQELQIPPNFKSFDFDASHYEEHLHKYSAYIFLSSDILEPCFETQNLFEFILRVKKCYRSASYHNYEHAFYVLHFIFCILLKNKDFFSTPEIVSVLLAALCHDIDHSGYTNTLLSIQNDVIYQLYGDFCGEIHRYEFTLNLIQQTDLLSNFSPNNFAFICKNLKKLIMSFDLSVHFQNSRKITELLNANAFDWEDYGHRNLSQTVILTCSDYAFSFKSFEIVQKFTLQFYKELYKQGDLEKMMGFSPLPMMDRSKIDMYPENQVILLTVILVPIVEIIIRLFPNLVILRELLNETLNKWKEILQFRGVDMWRLNDALFKERTKKGFQRVALSSTVSSIRTISSVLPSDARSIKSGRN